METSAGKSAIYVVYERTTSLAATSSMQGYGSFCRWPCRWHFMAYITTYHFSQRCSVARSQGVRELKRNNTRACAYIRGS